MSASGTRPDVSPKIRQSSPRSRLGRVALEAAKELPEVAEGVSGAQRLWATEDEGEIMAGVIVAARRNGTFDVELHLIARWPFGSLFDLADQVRDRVARAASAAELQSVLGEVSVSFEDVVEPGADDQTAAGVESEQPQ